MSVAIILGLGTAANGSYRPVNRGSSSHRWLLVFLERQDSQRGVERCEVAHVEPYELGPGWDVDPRSHQTCQRLWVAEFGPQGSLRVLYASDELIWSTLEEDRQKRRATMEGDFAIPEDGRTRGRPGRKIGEYEGPGTGRELFDRLAYRGADQPDWFDQARFSNTVAKGVLYEVDDQILRQMIIDQASCLAASFE